MKPEERSNLITYCADKLSEEEWKVIDLTLVQFGIQTNDFWEGTKYEYVAAMLNNARTDNAIKELSKHLNKMLVSKEPLTFPEIIQELLTELNKQKEIMIGVATGQVRIQDVNDDFIKRNSHLQIKLAELGLENPNTFSDLWKWYARWRDGSLPTYQSRRMYVSDLFEPTIKNLQRILRNKATVPASIPTGWQRVDRTLDKAVADLATAKNEEDYQGIGLLCRDALVSLAQAAYDPQKHTSNDGINPSPTDSKRMLEAFLSFELSGAANEGIRKLAKAQCQYADEITHKRTATFRDAAICMEATRSLTNTIAIIVGRRDPK